MGLGRKERDEELEEIHRKYIDSQEGKGIPDYVQQMYDEEYDHFHSDKRRKPTNHLRTVRIISRVMLVGVIVACLLSFIFMFKSC